MSLSLVSPELATRVHACVTMALIPVVINGNVVSPFESIVSHANQPKQVQILVLGSSHIKHLDTYIRKQHLDNFTLDPSDIHVMCLGTSGLSVFHSSQQKCLKGQMIHIETLRPDILVLHVGSNDLSDNERSVVDIIDELFVQANEALSVGVRHVVISQQFKRDIGAFFNNRVVQYNILAGVECISRPHISFWHHNGLWGPKNGLSSILKFDKTHLNDLGNDRFFHSIKDAVIYAKNNCI